ncbi:MAG: hypothetical protein KKB79_01820 [Nanoarchaeota archaeon]|nr:hypothetical protein [Nanoarchaeota archaeon]
MPIDSIASQCVVTHIESYQTGGMVVRSEPYEETRQKMIDSQRSNISITGEKEDSSKAVSENPERGGLPFLAVVLSRGRDGNVYRSRAVVYDKGLIIDFLA